ncbi:hypothetical protein KKH23_03575 [Patescibacteria group bacterium]|uniref:Uncharacterized protein n=1 Tax=viral metagenome TaxID=1070528 RepID=A0A6M3M611_9ZZZZ|nr:hypothetical protein [Patescibacteria group bacterium]MBU0776876.1 hypothetical protein [Patescibacteria group bacterium]MBU0846245.1 hypothetical protein [Patescibacteria group bacterium]MBU0922592.1 hypothetical protein [Patescibacteria group bacterium]MBU1066643.1 hypothetical protein [Patescibacteria group bacterium]
MKCLRELYTILDNNAVPGCSKVFLRRVLKKNGRMICRANLLKNGSDTRPLLELEIIEQDKGGGVHLTPKSCATINKYHGLGLIPTYTILLKYVDSDKHFRSQLSAKQRKSFRKWARKIRPEAQPGLLECLKDLRGNSLQIYLNKLIPKYPQEMIKI